MNDDAAAWGDFWARNSGGDGSGCLPQRWAGIEAAQRGEWQAFAQGLPEGAAVLDLATGDARVLRWLLEERPDLVATGIDLAPELPAPPDGVTVHSGVSMTQLPFEANTFDAVVSQFGFEYADPAEVSGEIARVLKPTGRVQLMVHRGDGPILEHNLARVAAIDWALETVDLPGSVTKALKTQGAGAPVAAQVAAAIARLGAAKFGQSSPAWEIAEAMRRACVMGGAQGIASIEATIGAITARADNEKGRIRSLERACARADKRDGLIAAFASAGLELERSWPVSEPSGRAFADCLSKNDAEAP